MNTSKKVDELSHRLRYILNLRNMKSIELAFKTGIDKSQISHYLKGDYKAKQDTLYLMADALNVNPVWLMGYDVPMEKNFNTQPTFNEQKHILTSTEKSEEYYYTQSFPLLGTVKAGYDYLAHENFVGYVTIDKKLPDPENYYALSITGDSMQPILYENDIVIVHKQNDVENGQVGIILIDNEEATVKKVIKYNDYIELVSFNPYYSPKRLDNKDNFSIIGKVIEARINKIFE